MWRGLPVRPPHFRVVAARAANVGGEPARHKAAAPRGAAGGRFAPAAPAAARGTAAREWQQRQRRRLARAERRVVAAFERGHRAGLERRVRRGEGKGAPDDLRAVRRGEVARERQPRRQVDAAHERVVAQVGELAPPQHEGLAHQLEQAAARHRPDRARRAAPARAAGAALERVQHPRADRDQVVAEHARRQRRLLAVRAREAERALADAASEIARAAARARGGAVARHRVDRCCCTLFTPVCVCGQV